MMSVYQSSPLSFTPGFVHLTLMSDVIVPHTHTAFPCHHCHGSPDLEHAANISRMETLVVNGSSRIFRFGSICKRDDSENLV